MQGQRARRPIHKQLWLGGFGVGVFIVTLLVGNAFIDPQKAVNTRMLGHDFLAFYMAGSFVREGHPERLYDLKAVADFEHDVAAREDIDLGKSIGPWWNPPFYAWIFVPLAGLRYRMAMAVWMSINLAALAGAMLLLGRMAACPLGPDGQRIGQRDSWPIWGLVPLLVLVSMPFIQAFNHGQNTPMSLLILAGVVSAWRGRRAVLAGLLVGLLAYKPQLGALVGLALVASVGWRALIGAAISGSALLAINLLTLPGTLSDYLHRLPGIVHTMMGEQTYLWERHVTLKAFWRLLLLGRDAAEPTWAMTMLYGASCAAVAIGLATAAVATWKRTRAGDARARVATDRLIAAVIVSMPLLMPFYFDYDLLLLAVPAALLARDMDVNCPADRWLLRAWMALFAWQFVCQPAIVKTHVNFSVILLAVIAGMMIARAIRADRRG